MAWYDIDVKCDPHIIWSRARIYRNVDGMRFDLSLERKNLNTVIQKVGDILQKNGFHASNERGDAAYFAYAELGYADSGFIGSDNEKVLYLNEPCNISVAVGGKDLFCIQSLLGGMDMHKALSSAKEAEELLDHEFDLAYLDGLGYVSPEIRHTGHGVQLSCAVYLPAISGLSELGKLEKKARLAHINMYPMTTYENNSSGIYILDLIPSPMQDTYVACDALTDFAEYIISLEKEYTRNIFDDNTAVLNKAWRTVGIMEYCSSCTQEELLKLISSIRLTHCIGCSDKLPYPISLRDLNCLQAQLMTSYLFSFADGCTTVKACDSLRADKLNEYINGAKVKE